KNLRDPRDLRETSLCPTGTILRHPTCNDVASRQVCEIRGKPLVRKSDEKCEISGNRLCAQLEHFCENRTETRLRLGKSARSAGILSLPNWNISAKSYLERCCE